MTDSYEELGAEIGNLVSEKQSAYGDSFGKIGDVLRILYPHGITLQKYDDMACIIRIIDKLFRIANKKEAFGESPFCDIIGYGLLGYARDLKSAKSISQNGDTNG